MNIKKIFHIVLWLCMAIVITSTYNFNTVIGKPVIIRGAGIKLNKQTVTLHQGESTQLSLTGIKKGIKWSTANKTIATVTNTGKVTGKRPGDVNITAAVNSKKYICKVTVKKNAPAIKSLSFQTKEITIYPEETFSLQLSVQPPDGDTKGLVYLSENSNVAGITTQGKIVAHNVGETIIYAQTVKGKKCTVKVNVVEVPTLHVRGKTISFGDSEEIVMKTFGYPDRGDSSVYGGKVLIYNNVRSQLIMIFINEGKVSGFFTDASVFSSFGITPDTLPEDIPDNFKQEDQAEWIRTYKAEGKYRVHVLMETLGTNIVRGIYVLSEEMGDKNLGSALLGQELEYFDVAMSMRSKIGISGLNWSEAATAAARMHGMDMIIRNYVSNGNYEGKSATDRLRDRGVLSTANVESILITEEDAILAAYRTLNTYEHRINLVNMSWTHLGVGVSVNQEGKAYIVQEYYY